MNLFATLISFTPSTGALTYSVDGVTQTSTLVSSTKPLRAALNRYLPTDPVRPIVTRWNTLIDSAKGQVTFDNLNPGSDIPNTFNGITSELAANDAKVQIHLKLKPNSDIVASLRPISFIPTEPI
ncbi:hypothetical protein [Neobacillus cucumis]|uniref:hypothetical protein n=1 Tax=Neobacillus cucumis TaxID=1740721 RepID=UPI001962C2BA|nr:hypothetical protein [Neobacillus cucumis]MBM7655228.1 hypothetical protein [Neobacillus cucumis]